jgi:hypothetical protein
MVLVVLGPGVVLLTLPFSRPLPELAVMDQLPRGCRLFSDPSTAGPVLLLRPDVTDWIDGRFDYWGAARTSEALDALTSTDLDAMPFSGATCVTIATDQVAGEEALVAALDRSEAWRAEAQEGPMRVWVRE